MKYFAGNCLICALLMAAPIFRNAISQGRWASAAANVRAPLGVLRSRALYSAMFVHTLPGAPDGDYVVIRFKAVFENKAAAIETVTPMKVADGVWRVCRYYIN